jgi:hypothetical protein
MNYPYPEGDIGDEGPLEDQGIYHFHCSDVPEGLSFFVHYSYSLTF